MNSEKRNRLKRIALLELVDDNDFQVFVLNYHFFCLHLVFRLIVYEVAGGYGPLIRKFPYLHINRNKDNKIPSKFIMRRWRATWRDRHRIRKSNKYIENKLLFRNSINSTSSRKWKVLTIVLFPFLVLKHFKFIWFSLGIWDVPNWILTHNGMSVWKSPNSFAFNNKILICMILTRSAPFAREIINYLFVVSFFSTSTSTW